MCVHFVQALYQTIYTSLSNNCRYKVSMSTSGKSTAGPICLDAKKTYNCLRASQSWNAAACGPYQTANCTQIDAILADKYIPLQLIIAYETYFLNSVTEFDQTMTSCCMDKIWLFMFCQTNCN